jgi:hypothetical protein
MIPPVARALRGSQFYASGETGILRKMASPLPFAVLYPGSLIDFAEVEWKSTRIQISFN